MLYTQERLHGNPAEVGIFESVMEFTGWLRKSKDLIRSHEATRSVWDTYATGNAPWIGREFSGGFEEFLDAAHKPWAEGLSVVDFMVEQLAKRELPRPQSIRRKPRWDEYEGDDLDMPRVWGGEAAWRSTHRRATVSCQTVTVVVDIDANGYVQPDDLLWRGVAGAALTKLLEEAGFRVEFWSAIQGRNAYTDGAWQCQAVCVKRPEDALDVITLVNTVSAWWLRLGTFAACGASPFGREPSYGFGSASPLATYGEFVERISPDPHKILISNVWAFPEAVALVNREVAKVAQLEVEV